MSNVYASIDLFDRILGLAKDGAWDEVAVLLDSNVTLVAQKDETGRSLLAEIARFPFSGDAIKRLIALGADVDGASWNENRALTNAIEGGSQFGANTLEEIRILVDAGASLTAEASTGYPPLHWAIVNCRPDKIRLLLKLGADPHQGSNDSPTETAYDVARRMKYEEAIELLEEHGQI